MLEGLITPQLIGAVSAEQNEEFLAALEDVTGSNSLNIPDVTRATLRELQKRLSTERRAI